MQRLSKLLLIFLCAWAFNTSAASFDCKKASSKTEKWICEDTELSSLDEKLARAYKLARDNSKIKDTLKHQQIEWIKGNIKNCTDIACLTSRYKARLAELEHQNSEFETNNESGKWKYIASGDEHTCVANDNEIRCWGNNYGRALNLPRQFSKITQLNSSWSSAVCAKDLAGWECWGECDTGICDIPTTYKDADKIVPGASHACGIKNGFVKCWGQNKYGQVDVPNDLRDAIDISVNNLHSCAVLSNGEVECWGREKYNLISSAEALNNAKKISVGLYFSCILNASNMINCGSSTGQKIDGFESYSNIKNIVAGIFSLCVINSYGQLSCLGGEIQGFNEGSIKNMNFFSVSVGRSHICGLSESGVFCWGSYANENPDLYKFPDSAKYLMNKSLLSK